jgi:purine-binding chemotaxis protein CheW
MATTATVEPNVSDLAGKYLTFKLDNETYGIEILKVQEIMGVMPITKVPRAPGSIRGVVNLRGKVIPIIDLRLSFALGSQENTDRTCIIVVQVCIGGALRTLGVVVDEVSEVLNIGSEELEAAPSFGTNVNTDFLLGIGKVGKQVVMLLDVDRALSGGEIEAVSLAGTDF